MKKPTVDIEVNTSARIFYGTLDGKSTRAAAMDILHGISGEAWVSYEVAKENPKAIANLQKALEVVDRHLREIKKALEPDIRVLVKLVKVKEDKHYREILHGVDS